MAGDWTPDTSSSEENEVDKLDTLKFGPGAGRNVTARALNKATPFTYLPLSQCHPLGYLGHGTRHMATKAVSWTKARRSSACVRLQRCKQHHRDIRSPLKCAATALRLRQGQEPTPVAHLRGTERIV
ncbi:hypothetical protein NDU88_004763 [Pleurodeles waltl]|uniref:Uncharacterized protein n=1 Tax=Pleurodeles waltl TaxID=8319 RepID=A0AAV7T912_PLEWA|nr:hypothetical protein NDU88_004763 [Pleurodeles waltl]